MYGALSRLDGVVQVEMQGKEATVTFDPETTKPEKLIEAFNKNDDGFVAAKA